MKFSLIKAIKSTHRHPANKILHGIGLFLYTISIIMIISSYLLKTPLNPIIFILLFVVAIALFLFGHNIEGNIKATTWVIIFKYIRAHAKNNRKLRIIKDNLKRINKSKNQDSKI
jgi:predicted membrane channel-forming protein YqfA (hemolysin III family)